ncbi:uncharacterized protein MONOS_13452 [Monocercomonoides exilis]|uniref:uncharacterized protein n=1 Tax=Monocercomonoides exilis TaxID=2049356 RepID=UPI00355A79DF|nr:hypothetical protein MONOS_13452 [Monocercomonoides exilis]|eukprot:MONOS_13452.1-p1 / transcript=MONOS_13452.1 / gene=MONOS_13452 / organism=Monocercomonoides_exilis_PA203 / gene_product=unspecified product / transcript_product=unspecified product / location=Mono_scaffold00831:7290-8006(-) / protein_length=205 / sequence_SO=supercontig / SO=protein_coding / is_pseudo=false
MKTSCRSSCSSASCLKGQRRRRSRRFLVDVEKIQSEKKDADASVFLGFLLNFFKAEAAKRKDEMKSLYDAICSGDSSTSSSSPSSSSGAVCKVITHSELESLLRMLSADSTGAVAADLLRRTLVVLMLSAIFNVSARSCEDDKSALDDQVQMLSGMPAGVVAGAVVGAVAKVVSGMCPVGRGKERRVARAVQDGAAACVEEQCG